jgi:hypothetical protein
MSILNWLKPKKQPEVPRAPRVVIVPFFPLRFITDDGSHFDIANISTSGIGFQRAAFATSPEIGSSLQGTLRLQDKSYPLSLRILNVSAAVVGSIIEPANSDYSRDLNSHLEVELSAVAARKIDPKLLKEDPSGKPHWFVGKQNSCELFLVEQDGKLKNFHCTIWGHYFESKALGHQRFGVISQATSSSSNIYPQSTLVEDVAEPTPELHEMVIRFIANIPNLEKPLREQLVERIAVKR